MSNGAQVEGERVQEERPAQDRGRRLRTWFSVAAALVVVAVGAFFVLNMGDSTARAAGQQDGQTDADGAEEEDGDAAVPIEVVTLEQGEISSYISATANLVAEEDVTVISETEGRLTVLHVEEGDGVEKGEVLAVLDSEGEEIAVRMAEVREVNTRRALERSIDLFSKKLVSDADHENVRLEHEVAEQELAEARWQLERNTFRAPFAGVVTSRSVQVGQHLRPGDELFRVTDFDPLIARVHLPETEVIALSVGRSVRLTLNADPAVGFPGRIRQISPVVDTATGTVTVTAEAEGPPPGVRPGSFVSVNIVSQRRADSVLLPKRAVLQELQASYVFVARDSVAERRLVALGLEEGEWVEALDGVVAGDQVVVAGQGGLKDGAAIRVLEP